jgi:hypothetical protein
MPAEETDRGSQGKLKSNFEDPSNKAILLSAALTKGMLSLRDAYVQRTALRTPKLWGEISS